MAKLWTDAEYAITNHLYEEALTRRAQGLPVSRADLVGACKRKTGRSEDASCLMHFGNMSAARAALGLQTLPELPPLANYPKKLMRFLESLHP
ncbi:hypothetical protein [Sagittula salina]|uniref:Uncharacterized protein n=1 Tax=Sagittula salina TaxID=2820268 RepID=A0A940MLL1_9RHOB|nr:hypothetical protein [Sagittula salina]MBP0480952.1 hypothetical protein [Sagittula salina]